MTPLHLPRRLVVLDEVGSTNTWLKEQADFHRPYGGVRARRQTAGRGRLERRWHSGVDEENLTCSFTLPVPARAVSVAPLVAGMALHRVISRFAAVRIKWPNDLLHEGKKLAGILCETIPGVDNLVIAGIGLNINGREFPPEIAAKTTSLALGTQQTFSVQKIWLSLYRELVRGFRSFLYPLSAEFISAYNAVAYRYVNRPEISRAPLEFKTLLPDGRAVFESEAGREIILDMAD